MDYPVFPVLDAKATGARIKELRQECDLRVSDISAYMGFESDQAVYKWQRGDSLPTLDNLLALSRLFHTTMDDIICEKEEAEQEPLPFFCVLWRLVTQIYHEFMAPFFSARYSYGVGQIENKARG